MIGPFTPAAAWWMCAAVCVELRPVNSWWNVICRVNRLTPTETEPVAGEALGGDLLRPAHRPRSPRWWG